ncbi:MAG: DUF1579 domain-containing protein [Armatimonadota bacterium]|nr:DUF1579 domain-containing protein [Armatimonadota bacterium]
MVGMLISIALIASQMPQGPTAGELEALKKLDFLVGTWEGEGSMMMPGGGRETFKGTETVQKKLQGKALLVEGKFEDKNQKVIHETLAVITYDEGTKKYVFQTYLFNRPGGTFDLDVRANGFAWKLNIPNGPKVDYEMALTDGKWIETGKYNVPNQGPVEFLKMTLAKRK